VSSASLAVNLCSLPCPFFLSVNGAFFGSYYDIEAVKTAGLHLQMNYGKSVVYVCTDPSPRYYGQTPKNGIAVVNVGGVSYRDPWLSTEQIFEGFATNGLSCEIIDGHQMMYGTSLPGYCPPPEWFLRLPKRAETSMYRAVIVHRPGKPARFGGNPVPPPLRDEEWTGIALRSLAAPYNKGMPLQYDDLKWISESSHWLAEKLDGVMVKIVYAQKRLTIIDSSGVARKYEGFKGSCNLEFVLQGEMISVGDSYRIVATDVLVAPWGTRGNFLSRWRWLEGIYYIRDSDAIRGWRAAWPFELQRWYKLTDPMVPEVIVSVKEGIVLQPLIAGFGALRKGAGSAAYVKRSYTIDRKVGPDVFEYTLGGEMVRPRPDKKIGNPPAVVDAIKKAVPFVSLCAYLFTVHVENSGPLPSLMAKLDSFIPVKEWSDAEKVNFYRYQNTLDLEDRYENLPVWRNQYYEFMCKEMLRELESEQGPVDVGEDYDFECEEVDLPDYVAREPFEFVPEVNHYVANKLKKKKKWTEKKVYK